MEAHYFPNPVLNRKKIVFDIVCDVAFSDRGTSNVVVEGKQIERERERERWNE